MILAICCPHCRHRGAVSMTLLPGTLTCWRCHTRSVFKDGREVRSRTKAILDRESAAQNDESSVEAEPTCH
jgi:hypothetical protein